MKSKVIAGVSAVLMVGLISGGYSHADPDGPNCNGLPTPAQLRAALVAAPSTGGDAGGLFSGTKMWGAVVNRHGDVCAYATSTTDQTQVWPGSQAIAKAKAYTANAFSLDTLPLSTAELYTFSQPGHSLWGLNQSQPFDPSALGASGGKNQVNGGIITFGGGVPIYKNGKIIGGIGVSGDTACSDHEIAKRTRSLLGLNPPGGALADDITYSAIDGPNAFTHPACINTWRNGVNLGLNEAPAVGY